MSSTGEAMPGLEKQRVMDRVAQDGSALQYAPAEFKGDREIVLAAVAKNGFALRYAAAELKGDRKFVLAAVAQNCHALLFAPAEFKRDHEIVLAALPPSVVSALNRNLAKGVKSSGKQVLS